MGTGNGFGGLDLNGKMVRKLRCTGFAEALFHQYSVKAGSLKKPKKIFIAGQKITFME
jgi:hypothetical protein